jgi:anti-anti-sigma regulatory factor
MLRITIEDNSTTATLKLEGKLSGPWVDELESTWYKVTNARAGDSVLLDLCDVTFIDPEGRKQLAWMYSQGARFKTSGCLGKGIVEEIVREAARAAQ